MKGRIYVFIVDDNDLILKVLQMSLERYKQLDIKTFEDAGSFLRETIHRRPDAVFVDHCLGNVTGTQVIIELRSALANPPKIIAMSGWGDDIEKEMMNAGADAFLLKPFSKVQAVASLEKVLDIKLGS
jgi:FixJ family two-component response regulator